MIEKIQIKIVEKVNKQKQTRTYEITSKSMSQEKLEKLKTKILEIVEAGQTKLTVKRRGEK